MTEVGKPTHRRAADKAQSDINAGARVPTVQEFIEPPFLTSIRGGPPPATG